MALADTNEQVHCATKHLAPALSDSVPVADAGLWRGVRCNAAAAVTANLVLTDDSAVVSYLLQPGEICPISVKLFKTGGTAVQGDLILLR